MQFSQRNKTKLSILCDSHLLSDTSLSQERAYAHRSELTQGGHRDQN